MSADPISLAPDEPPIEERQRDARRPLRLLGVLLGCGLVVSLLVHQGWAWWRLLHRAGFLGAAEARTALLVHATACLVLGGMALLGSRAVRSLAIGAASAIAVGVLTATSVAGRAWDVAVTAMVVVAAWKIGDLMVARLRSREARSLRAVPAVTVVLGLMVVGLVVQVIGRVGAISAWTCGLPLMAVAIVALPGLTRRARCAVPAIVSEMRSGPLHAAVAVVLLLQLAWSLLYAAAPEIQFDPVYGKAWLPAFWSEVGRIRTLVEHPIMANVGLSQLDAVPGHVLGAAAIGRYLQVAAGILIVSSLWQLGRRRTWWTGPALAAALGLMPHVLWQSSTAHDDLVLALACLALAIVVVHLPAGGTGQYENAMLTGLLAGGVVAFKLHLAVYAMAAALAWSLSRRGSRVPRIGVVATSAAAVAVPGMLFRYVDTGNPLFPQFNAVFRSDYFPHVNTTWNMPYAPGGLLELLKLPWTLVEEPMRLMEHAPPGGFGMSVVILLAALLGSRSNHAGAHALWITLLVAIAAWWVQLRYVRYLLPYVVVAAGLVSVAIAQHDAARARTRGRQSLAAAMVILFAAASFASSVASFWKVPERVPLAVALGSESPDAYRRKAIPVYGAIMAFNRLAEPGAMTTGDAYARTLLRPDLDYTPEWELALRVRLRGEFPTTAAGLYDAWRALGVRWLIVATGRDLDPEKSLVGAMLRDYGNVRFSGDGHELYELGPSPHGAVGTTDR